ncbi:RloB family protein [Mucilaginibacter sp.]|uniref:RloB family protein n=1 Tax=Mucilaginibacter sp. TaxID=1882438 RepID=UPI0028472D78|nr:RloB family protein [Mucilaginibacter sp.]MDR3693994.1 RloB family protein [Mucilaginibacter sp.]
MILTNRLFDRRPATRNAKSIYIFCEGVKREFQYFGYFKEIDSRINIEVYKLSSHEDNSPSGLYNIACNCILKTEENPNPKYEFLDDDELWIVIDTDEDKLQSRKPQIEKLRVDCSKHNNWNIAQSNPCFEVWLYYHFFTEKLSGEELSKSKYWKKILNENINGGFNSQRHPIYIETAIRNSEAVHSEIDNIPYMGCTQVYRLAKVIYPLVMEKFTEILRFVVDN